MFDFDVITGPSPTDVRACQRPPMPPNEAPPPAPNSGPSGVAAEATTEAVGPARDLPRKRAGRP